MRILRWSLVAVLLVLAVGSTGWAAEAKFSAPRPFMLALGDSLAFGYQEAKFLAGLPDPNPATFNTGFADVFAVRLAETATGNRTALVNLSCPGETTGTFLDGGCPYPAAGFELHVDYTGAQMEFAEAFLEVHRGQVSPILISLGANDVLAIIAVCGLDLECIGPLLPGVVTDVIANYSEVLTRLRSAAPDAEIILLQLYNPFAVLNPDTDVAAVALNDAIAIVAAAHQARVANAFPAFNLTPPQPATLCTLTLFCTPLMDVHASDDGYSVIGDLMFEAAGYTRFEH
jgi:lysophospholipase L1-like esterase